MIFSKQKNAVGALLWMLCAQYFLAEQIARLAWTAPYSFLGNFISDLGATACADRPPGSGHFVCSPLHNLMNGSFFVQGFLIAGGAWLLNDAFPPGRLRNFGLSLLLAAGPALSVVGLAPEDALPGVHFCAAAIHLVGSNLALILLGASGVRSGKPIFSAALAFGTLGLGALALLASGHTGALGPGGMERLGAYPLTLWLCMAGTWLFAGRFRDTITS